MNFLNKFICFIDENSFYSQRQNDSNNVLDLYKHFFDKKKKIICKDFRKVF